MMCSTSSTSHSTTKSSKTLETIAVREIGLKSPLPVMGVTFICLREQSVCHVVSTWREDWVPPAEILCRDIPVSVITLMILLFIGCCFMAHFDLVLKLGGSLRPKVLVLETLAAEFIFEVPFILRWVNICFLYMREILG